MKTTIIIVFGGLIAGVVGIAWNAAHSTQRTQSAIATVAQKRGQTEGEIRRVEAQLAAAEAEQTARHSAQGGLQAPTTMTATATTTMASSGLTAEELEVKLRQRHEQQQNPEAQLRTLAQVRARFSASLLPLVRKLALSPAQAEKFMDLSMKVAERNIDLLEVAAQSRLPTSDPAIAALRAENFAGYRSALQHLLGEAGYQQFQEFKRAEHARFIVGGIAGTAVAAGTQFTVPQLEQLVEIVSSASAGYRNGRNVGDDIDWNVVDAQARTILSDAQFAAFTMLDGPPPLGSRFRSEINRTHGIAEKVEAAAKAAQAVKPSGG